MILTCKDMNAIRQHKPMIQKSALILKISKQV